MRCAAPSRQRVDPGQLQCREINVSKPILYRHFTDRGGLYPAIVQRFAHELDEDLDRELGRNAEIADALATDDGLAQLDRAVDAYLCFIERDVNVYRFLVQRAASEHDRAQHAIDEFVGTVSRKIADVVRVWLVTAGRGTRGADAWGCAIVGMVNAVGDWWLDHDELTRDEVRQLVVTLAWHGMPGLGLAETSTRKTVPATSAPSGPRPPRD